MNGLLAAYGDGGEESDEHSDISNTSIRLPTVSELKTSNSNPTTVDLTPANVGAPSENFPILSERATSMFANLPISSMSNIYNEATRKKNTLTGLVEAHNMSTFQFNANFDADRRNKQESVPVAKREKRSRGDVSSSWWGSWAPPDDADDAPPGEAVGLGPDAVPLSDADAAAIDARDDARKKARVADAKAKSAATSGERSVFHGKRLTDYQGRTYIWPPTDVKPGEHKCYLPKRLMHTYVGHTKGVNRIRFFPKYGHILLSASMDTTIKIWDMRNDHERQCLRTIYGHTQAVREVAFNGDGKTFLSCGYDKVIRQWDTETGACVTRLNNGVLSYCAQYYPLDENVILAGAADNYIYQWDMRANEVVQTYTEHQGAVNTVTFFDQNRRFMSTSDDKKIFLWEFGIPVVIKHISDPEMHAAPAVAMHPSGEFAACQNLNNVITVYESNDGTMRKKNKSFKGHMVAGYACDLAFSPDGQFLASGDGNGECVFWDWKKTSLYAKLKCHDGVAISCQWHPVEPSQVATAGWDGKIQLWN
jgi:WD40 repeat protein